MTNREAFDDRPIRYAVVGAGHITQAAVLPAFEQAENAELVAIFSDDDAKREELSSRYDLEHALTYDDYDDFLGKGLVDAVYIAVPNHLHCDYTVRAARCGVHVLCEKPMAVDERECEKMMRTCDENDVKLMIAYRLHFDVANLEAIDLVERGVLGMPRLFESVFSQNVHEGNIRLAPISMGGGSVYDLGVYCINAARYLFRDEPTEVMAASTSRNDPRFDDADEMTSAILRFPEDRIATFTTSFGAHDVSRYSVIGTKGRLVMEPAYEYAVGLRYTFESEEGKGERSFEKHDQFGPQLLYFSECILRDREPEPDGLTGLVDVHIVRSIYQAASEGRSIRLLPIRATRRPDLSQAITRPGIEKPPEVHASSPRQDS
jgi:predicted dehydrogenase